MNPGPDYFRWVGWSIVVTPIVPWSSLKEKIRQRNSELPFTPRSVPLVSGIREKCCIMNCSPMDTGSIHANQLPRTRMKKNVGNLLLFTAFTSTLKNWRTRLRKFSHPHYFADFAPSDYHIFCRWTGSQRILWLLLSPGSLLCSLHGSVYCLNIVIILFSELH